MKKIKHIINILLYADEHYWEGSKNKYLLFKFIIEPATCFLAPFFGLYLLSWLFVPLFLLCEYIAYKSLLNLALFIVLYFIPLSIIIYKRVIKILHQSRNIK